MTGTSTLPIVAVVQQHLDEVIGLWNTRSVLLTSPDVTLRSLAWIDERIAAHLDGLSVAGEHAWPICEAALASPSAGSVFAAVVRAIEAKEPSRLKRLVDTLTTTSDGRRGLTGACGWLDRERLQGIVPPLLASDDPTVRALGVAACAVHRVDPGLLSGRWIGDSDAGVRARALRAAGELGRRELMSACAAALHNDDAESRLWAAWSSVALGDRNVALAVLAKADGVTDGLRSRAFDLSLQAMAHAEAHRFLQGFRDPQLHCLIRGSGIAGDAAYVPWLIRQMHDTSTARGAGESFSLITGADLASLGLERTAPEDFDAGPNDDAGDPDVAPDRDRGLPWPDPARVERWWRDNRTRFETGTRYFMGAPITSGHCIEVLKTGYQRQRILAAHYLCLLDPGTPLFNTSAPASRQQRLLAEMK
jgi:uncharacterized protein (TIGR02270 family)